MSCDAWSCSRPTVRPACRCCPDTVVVSDNPACLPTTATPASGRTALHRKVVAAAGAETGDSGAQERSGDGVSPPRRYRFTAK